MNNNFVKYHKMSPFEIRNMLISIAKKSIKKNVKHKKFLDAGRGNPNFFNYAVRDIFSDFMLFANDFAKSYIAFDNVAYKFPKENIYKKFQKFITKQKKLPNINLLKKTIDYAIKTFKFDRDEFLYELSLGCLGILYPTPIRILEHVEKIIIKYLSEILSAKKQLPKGKYKLFATEGATSAMIYIFNSLKNNNILNPNDKIAIGTPIFSPYLEIPHLKEFNFVSIFIEADEKKNWQISGNEIEKLKDKSIKAFFLVDPANPTSSIIDKKTIKRISDIIKNERKDLILICDSVYAPFINNYTLFMDEVYKNLILVYSFSKYFGSTGWRLGLIMIHDDHVIDKLIKNQDILIKKEVEKRYDIITNYPSKIKFIDRLVYDSRYSALAHTAGLSCPQQIIMAFFALFELIDKGKYKKLVHEILKKRISVLYENLEIVIPKDKNTHYYALLDLAEIARKKYGIEFKNYLIKNVDILEYLFQLAKTKYIICLPGEGFEAPLWTIRISIANLDIDDYRIIGKSLIEVLDDFYKKFKKR